MICRSYKGLWIDDKDVAPDWAKAQCISHRDKEGHDPCRMHLPDCDGGCRHMSGHVNECMLIASKAIREMLERREQRESHMFIAGEDGTLTVHAAQDPFRPVKIAAYRVRALLNACVDALVHTKNTH